MNSNEVLCPTPYRAERESEQLRQQLEEVSAEREEACAAQRAAESMLACLRVCRVACAK